MKNALVAMAVFVCTAAMAALPLPEKYAARRAANRRYAERHDARH